MDLNSILVENFLCMLSFIPLHMNNIELVDCVRIQFKLGQNWVLFQISLDTVLISEKL